MRDVSAAFLAAVAGSNRPIFAADVWLGSDIIRSSVPLAPEGSVSWDAGNAVEDRCTLTLVDEQSSSSRLKDIIHAYGCRLNVKAGFDLPDGPELVSLGWFDITSTAAVEDWRWFDWRDDDDPVKVGEVVKVNADGLLSVVARSGLVTPVQLPTGSDAWAAIAQLCVGIISVKDPGFEAKALPSGDAAIVVDTDRLKTIQQIADLWGAKPVITGDGQLTLAIAGEGPRVPDYGVMINVEQWKNETASADLRNGVVFGGRTAAGLDVFGYWFEQSGPLAWGGPFGYRPRREFSPLMTTQAMVDDAAVTAGARMIRERTATQTVNALWNPAQQVRDRPYLKLPDRWLDSEITRITLPFSGGSMSTTLRLPLFAPDYIPPVVPVLDSYWPSDYVYPGTGTYPLES